MSTPTIINASATAINASPVTASASSAIPSALVESSKKTQKRARAKCRNHNRGLVFRKWIVSTFFIDPNEDDDEKREEDSPSSLLEGAEDAPRDADDTSKEQKPRKQPSSSYRQYYQPPNQNQNQHHILDIAGGKGDVGILFAIAGYTVTIIDPRITRDFSTHPLVKNMAYHIRMGNTKTYHAIASRLKPKEPTPREKNKKDGADEEEEDDNEEQEGEGGEEWRRLPMPGEIRDFFAFTPNVSELSDSSSSSSDQNSIQQQEMQTALRTATLLIGMHPDEATEPIVQHGLHHGLPFAIVPCCVFPQSNPHRRHPLGPLLTVLSSTSPPSLVSAFLQQKQQQEAQSALLSALYDDDVLPSSSEQNDNMQDVDRRRRGETDEVEEEYSRRLVSLLSLSNLNQLVGNSDASSATATAQSSVSPLWRGVQTYEDFILYLLAMGLPAAHHSWMIMGKGCSSSSSLSPAVVDNDKATAPTTATVSTAPKTAATAMTHATVTVVSTIVEHLMVRIEKISGGGGSGAAGIETAAVGGRRARFRQRRRERENQEQVQMQQQPPEKGGEQTQQQEVERSELSATTAPGNTSTTTEQSSTDNPTQMVTQARKKKLLTLAVQGLIEASCIEVTDFPDFDGRTIALYYRPWLR